MKTNILLLSILIFCFACRSQPKNGCVDIINNGGILISQEDKVCKELEELNKTGIKLHFFLKGDDVTSDDMIQTTNRFFSVDSSKKSAVLFLNPKNEQFTILFSNGLKNNQYLQSRYIFQTFVYKRLKIMNDTFFSDVISEFRKLFSEAKKPF